MIEIVLPKQPKEEPGINLNKEEDDTVVRIETQTVIVAEVIGFYSPSFVQDCWALNPKQLPFANFNEDFTKIKLVKKIKDGAKIFSLTVSFEVEDPDKGIWEQDKVLQVQSAREIKNFPSP